MEAGRIDLHTHILPGVDDGARTMEDALAMARLAVNSGVRTVVTTPHSNRDPRFASLVESRVRALQYRLRCEGIPLRVLPGMEIFATEDTPARLAQGTLLPLAGTRYALVEFDFEEEPFFIEQILQGVRAVRFVPVMAHPERYACVGEQPELVRVWRQDGCLIQVNKGSLLGRFGEEIRETALQLLQDGVVTVVASDAHSPLMRTTEMATVAQFLSKEWSPAIERELLWENPRRLLADEM